MYTNDDIFCHVEKLTKGRRGIAYQTQTLPTSEIFLDSIPFYNGFGMSLILLLMFDNGRDLSI